MKKQLCRRPSRTPTAKSLNNLANALYSKGDRKSLDEAINLHRQSIKMRKQLYGRPSRTATWPRRSTTWPMRSNQKATERAWMRPSICTDRASR